MVPPFVHCSISVLNGRNWTEVQTGETLLAVSAPAGLSMGELDIFHRTNPHADSTGGALLVCEEIPVLLMNPPHPSPVSDAGEGAEKRNVM